MASNNHQQQQQNQQQAFPNMPLSLGDIENHHQQEMLLYSTMYGQNTQTQVYFDDSLDSLLMDQDVGMRSRAYSHDFTLSPIDETPTYVSAHKTGVVGPLPPAPPLFRSRPLPSSIPAPVATMKAKEIQHDYDKKPAYASLPNSTLVSQAHLHFASCPNEFPVKF